jgi:hypothetical protein
MAQGGVDFGIVGQAYEAADTDQDFQRLINWYVEVSKDSKSKTPTALLGCPGLNRLLTLDAVGPVRGAWVLPGGQEAIVVRSDRVYLITVAVPPTNVSIAQLAYLQVGTLATNTGPVAIRDNGAGGYVVLVDGPNGYYYRIDSHGTAIPGTATFTFTGTPTNLSVTVPYAGTLPTQLIVGQLINGAGIVIGTRVAAINSSMGTITLDTPANASPGPTLLTVILDDFAQITDTNFLGADKVDFIDGWLIFNQPSTQNFYTNAPVPYTLIFDGSFFAKNDSSSDNIVTLEALSRDLWIVGERHTEIWFDAGGANFAFQRIPGAAPQMGCAAVHSITKVGDSLMWLAHNQEGGVHVVKTEQYTTKSVTTPAVANTMSNYPLVFDAVAYSYMEQGHHFYVISFPTQETTWVYDLETDMWHQRARFDSSTAQFGRHRSNCFMNFQNLRIVGDFSNGRLYQLSRTVYTDDDQPLIALRRCPHIWSRENRERIFTGSLQVEFKPGVGLASGAAADVDPHMMLSWSDDGGQTFGTEQQVPIGKIGETRNRAIVRRLGVTRDRVFQVRVSAAVKRDIVGATLYAEGST